MANLSESIVAQSIIILLTAASIKGTISIVKLAESCNPHNLHIIIPA